jgi:hypothetical protein
MTGQFNTARQLDREWDAIEYYVRPRVEQDEMAAQKAILDVVRKPW